MLIGCERCGASVGESTESFTSNGSIRILRTEYDIASSKGIVYFLCPKCYTDDDLDEMNRLKKARDEELLLNIQFNEIVQ